MKRAGVLVRELDGELVILDSRSNQIHQLNETAAFVWKAARTGNSLAAIASSLTNSFVVDPETAVADSTRTLQELEGLGLLDPEVQGATQTRA